MATLLGRYKEICELQESSRLRNEQMMKDAIRLRNIFVPVNTESLENLKSEWLKALTVVAEAPPSTSYPFNLRPAVSHDWSPTTVLHPISNGEHYEDMITNTSSHTVSHTDAVVTTMSTITTNIRASIPVVSAINIDTAMTPSRINISQSSDSSLINSNKSNADTHTTLPDSHHPLQLPLQREPQDSKPKVESLSLPTSEIQQTLPSFTQPSTTIRAKDNSESSLQPTRPIATAIQSSRGASNGALRLNISDSDDDEEIQNERSRHEHCKAPLNDSDKPNGLLLESREELPVQPVKIEEETLCNGNDKDNDLSLSVMEKPAEENGGSMSTISEDNKAVESDNDDAFEEGTMNEQKMKNGLSREMTESHHKKVTSDQINEEKKEEHDDSEEDLPIRENGGSAKKGLTSEEDDLESDHEQSEDFWNDSLKTKPIENNHKQLESVDKGNDSTSSTSDIQSPEQRDHAHIISVIVNTINSNIRKDRELAQQLYTQSNLSDVMRDKIQDSPVLNSLLIKRAEHGQDISTWDMSALSSVLIKTLSSVKTTHNTPSIQDLTSVDSQWYSIWPHLLDHVRLLFQCGKTLESITEVFSIALGIDKAELFDVLQQECGIDPLSQQDFTVSSLTDQSSSVSIHANNNDVPSVTGGEAYRSFAQSLLQSSHNSEHVSSLSEDSDVAALQSFEPSPYRSKQQDEADKSNTATEETDDDFNNSLSLPLSDSLPKSKNKPVLLDKAAIKRRMGVMPDDDDVYSYDNHISVPSVDDDDDDFEFYQ